MVYCQKTSSSFYMGPKFNHTEKVTVKYQITYQNTSSKSDTNVTVVTAFFDLGTFRKGRPGHFVTPEVYNNWAKIFRFLKNPMIIFTDSEDFKLHMVRVRNDSMRNTKIFLIERSSSWAFQNLDTIRNIFKAKDYPKHYPNTVVPEYACAQHAKYDMVERASKLNEFRTKYVMWLDIGYFRNRKSLKPFYLSKPKAFNDSRIAMNLVYSKRLLTSHPEEIILKNLVWVGGGLFFGEREHLIKFSDQFRRAVEYYLSKGLTNTDQQIIYAMFSDDGMKALKPEVKLHVYTSPNGNGWFYLGNAMVREKLT